MAMVNSFGISVAEGGKTKMGIRIRSNAKIVDNRLASFLWDVPFSSLSLVH